jgi:hypothetical protein
VLRLTALVAAVLLASPAFAAEVAAPKLTLSGMVDGYYTLNVTQGQDQASPTAGAGAYSSATGFNLGMAKLAAQAESGPATLKLDLAFGPVGQAITTGTTGASASHQNAVFVEQALVSMKFGKLTVDAGRFVTPVGFEVYEAKDNWLYSHGLLFNFALPTAHEGVRVSMPVTPELNGYAFLANGSNLYTNDVGFTGSPYKTVAVGATWAKEGMTLAGSFLISKDPTPGIATYGNDAFLLDLVFTKEMGATSFNVSGDLGSYDGSSYYGLGASIKHTLAEDGLRIVGRAELFHDKDGVHSGFGVLNPATGAISDPTLFSLTGGVNYPVGKNAEVRGELRYDNASEKVYNPSDPSNGLLTFTASAIAWF